MRSWPAVTTPNRRGRDQPGRGATTSQACTQRGPSSWNREMNGSSDVTRWKRALKCLYMTAGYENVTRSLIFIMTSPHVILFTNHLNRHSASTARLYSNYVIRFHTTMKLISVSYFLFKSQLSFLCLFFNVFTRLSFATITKEK